MKKNKLTLILLFILLLALFATNPEPEAYYKKALKAELNVGDDYFSNMKYSLVEAKYDYSSYVFFGVMKDKDGGGNTYIGFLNQVFKF